MENRTRFVGSRSARGETYALDARYEPKESEGAEEEDRVVGRYPAHFFAGVEDGQLIIRSRPSERKSDLLDMGTNDRQPPSTLAQLNKFMSAFYQRKPNARSARR